MRSIQTKLYSIAAPLALLPLMDMSAGQVPGWFKGDEFLTLLSEIIIQVFSGFVNAIILLFTQNFFGVTGA